jgi:hypothetical protein
LDRWHNRSVFADLPVCCVIETGEILMTISGWIQILLFFAVLILLVKPLGGYMAKVLEGEKTFLTPVLGGVDRG